MKQVYQAGLPHFMVVLENDRHLPSTYLKTINCRD